MDTDSYNPGGANPGGAPPPNTFITNESFRMRDVNKPYSVFISNRAISKSNGSPWQPTDIDMTSFIPDWSQGTYNFLLRHNGVQGLSLGYLKITYYITMRG